jgi:ABC-type phosphate transport system substrate-binding protein
MTFASTRLRVLLAALVAVCTLGALSGTGAATGFPTLRTACSGGSILGRGASFQREAQRAWGARIAGAALEEGFRLICPEDFELGLGAPEDIDYDPAGSGAGRSAILNRTAGVHFGASDDPLTIEEFNAMDAGPEVGQAARIKQLPVAASAVAVLVRLPAGCTVAPAERTMRRELVEAAFRNTVTPWERVLPGIEGDVTGPETPCRDASFRRVVRLDVSGTTIQLKTFLDDVNPALGWLTEFENRAWPNDAGATSVLRGATNGNGPLIARLSEGGEGLPTRGGIGYSDLATARAAGYGWDGEADSQFWVRLEGVSPAAFSDATEGQKGANCATAEYSLETIDDFVDVEELVFRADWRDVNSIDTAQGYPICALTYDLVYEDGALGGLTEAETRTVFDYLTYATSPAGQELLPAFDYAELPAEIQEELPAAFELMGYGLDLDL